MIRVAVVDAGTNSTRLLIADVAGGALEELDRRAIVTRLGEGVDASGRLAGAAMERVFAVLDEYAAAIEVAGCERRTAVMTSAVRDAANGAWFAQQVARRYGLRAHTLSGAEEARLTFAGATATLAARAGELAVVDIGGGSTEIVCGWPGGVSFFASLQVGVVRFSERHLRHDPPAPVELAELAAAVAAQARASVPADVLARVDAAVAVAGTATSCAAIDLELDPYVSAAVEGHVLPVERLRAQLARLASLPLAERRRVVGLHPDRAPTIVAGVAILLEVLRAFALEEVTVSDRDILWGVALECARARSA